MTKDELDFMKLDLIRWITSIEDPSIFLKLRKIQIKFHNEFIIPEWHKELVRERIKNSNPADYLPLEDLDKEIKLGKVKVPKITKKQIIKQTILAEKEIKKGKTTPHDQVVKDSKNWGSKSKK